MLENWQFIKQNQWNSGNAHVTRGLIVYWFCGIASASSAIALQSHAVFCPYFTPSGTTALNR